MSMKKRKTPFGICFAELRKKRSLTIKDASKLLGISPAYISAIEYGNREIPRGFRKLLIVKFKLTLQEIDYVDRSMYATPAHAKITFEDIKKMMSNMIDSMTNDPQEREKYKNDFYRRLEELKEKK